MEVISDPIDKVRVELARCGICSFKLFDVVISGISKEGLFFVLSEQTWNLTSGQNHTHEFKELFFFDFRVSENEAAMLAKPTGNFEVFLDVLLEILLRVVFDQLDLFVLHTLDEGRETCERLLAATSDTD